jgi:hypothetical protein
VLTVALPLMLVTDHTPLVVLFSSCVVDPTVIFDPPIIARTVGLVFTVITAVGNEAQPSGFVKVNVAVPAETPVTTPELFTVATAGLLLDHVPPVEGDNVVVELMQIVFAPDILAAKFPFTVTAAVGNEAQPSGFVKVNVAVPAETPVTTPELFTVATAGLLLDHVPPVEGDNVVVELMQIVFAPDILAAKFPFTVTAAVGNEAQPSDFVKVKVAVPAETPVTIPELFTVATAGLLLDHVPPVEGDNVVVELMQIAFAPDILAAKFPFTVTAAVGNEAQPSDFVKVNVAVPAETPITTPELFTVATAGLLLDHVPAAVGDNEVVPPIQTELDPVILTTGLALTVTAGVANEEQVPVLVYVKVADPTEIPFTTPEFVTVATALLLLVHIPPVVGDNVVVPSIQIALGPVILPTGQELTVTARVANEVHPPVLVKVKVADPTDNPVTVPSLLTVAILVLLLDHVPSVVGDNLVVPLIQIELDPVTLTTGILLTVTAGVANEEQVPVLV